MEKKSAHKRRPDEAVLAPGIGAEGLERRATAEEIAENNVTTVTRLEYDEYDPSESERD